jgi:release factor glutamine methyltransferase
MNSLKRQTFYNDLKLQIFESVYEPAEDTFLAADALDQIVHNNDAVLEIGTGCGILAIIAARKVRKVVATDINPHAVKCAMLNAKTNQLDHKIEMRRGDLFRPVKKAEKYDVIVFNAPYLPCDTEDQTTWLERSWVGGPTGRQIIDRFILEAPCYLEQSGKILLVQSSLANIDETLKRFRQQGLRAKVIAEKKVSFETIVVIQASHLFEQHIKSGKGENT